MVREGHTRPRGPSESPDGVDPNIRRTRHNVTVITVGSKNEVYVRSPVSSHMQPFNNPFKPCNKVRGKNIVKEVFLSFLHASFIPASSLMRRLSLCQIFVAASHQTRLDTRSKARRPIKVGIKGRGRSGTSRDSNPACLCCSSAHLVQCEPDEASSFTNPNVGPGTYAS